MRYVKWAAIFGLVFATMPAYAECENGTSDADIKACLSQELRDSDQRINAVYKALMVSRDEAGKTQLRDQQRAWLKSRDKACNLDNKESDREKWLQAILADQAKTVCVVRYTFSRVTELNDQLQQAGGAPPPDLPPAPQAPKFAEEPASNAAPALGRFTYFDDGYQLRSNASHDKGKWYYEATIDQGRIALLGDVLLTLGLAVPPPGPGGVVHLINIRRTRTDLPSVNVGYAIDLDSGAVSTRVNGVWSQQPGSAAAVQIKLNRPYQAYLEGSSPIESLLKRDLVKINLGEKPFEYALPDGYRPFSER